MRSKSPPANPAGFLLRERIFADAGKVESAKTSAPGHHFD
jgi:hypothetical protein